MLESPSRIKKKIDYAKFNGRGINEQSDNDDKDTPKDKGKKTTDTAKLKSVEETRAKLAQIFKQAKEHPAKQILDKPIYKDHPKYEEFKDYIPLCVVDTKVSVNMYANVNDVKNEVLKIILTQQ